jgi:hypothetical protein
MYNTRNSVILRFFSVTKSVTVLTEQPMSGMTIEKQQDAE